MAISPRMLHTLPLDKINALSMLQLTLDGSLAQHASISRGTSVTLNRGRYDSEVLRCIIDIYQAQGWNVDITEQGGAVVFIFAPKQMEDQCTSPGSSSMGHRS
jgi:hypothetical protein